MRKVYTVVFFGEDIPTFRELPNTYLHHAKYRTEEGMELPLLQEYLFVELEKFEKLTQEIDTEEKAWLKLLLAKDRDSLLELGTNFTSLQNPTKDVILFSKETKKEPHMIWEEDEYMIRDHILKLQRQRDEATAKAEAANAEKEAAYAEKEALLRTLSIFRLHVAGRTLEQIAQELSLSVEEVERELGSFAKGIL